VRGTGFPHSSNTKALVRASDSHSLDYHIFPLHGLPVQSKTPSPAFPRDMGPLYSGPISPVKSSGVPRVEDGERPSVLSSSRRQWEEMGRFRTGSRRHRVLRRC
jgi:hypothetical protein